MTRLLKILAYAVILFLLYLVITGFLKSCNSKKNVESVALEDGMDNMQETEFFEEEEFTSPDTELFADNVENLDEIDYGKIDAAVEKRTKTQPANSTPPTREEITPPATPKPTYTPSEGDYMVIAGNYIINTNAENMVLKLKKSGFNNAEIVIFDMSQYHSVVANRFTDYNSAYSLVQELEAKGIDSYVHRKK